MINLGYFFGCCRSLLVFDLVIVNRRGSLYIDVDCCKSLLIISWLLSVLGRCGLSRIVLDCCGDFSDFLGAFQSCESLWVVVGICR